MLGTLKEWLTRYADKIAIHEEDDDDELVWVGVKEKISNFHSETSLGRMMHPEAAQVLLDALRQRAG